MLTPSDPNTDANHDEERELSNEGRGDTLVLLTTPEEIGNVRFPRRTSEALRTRFRRTVSSSDVFAMALVFTNSEKFIVTPLKKDV